MAHKRVLILGSHTSDEGEDQALHKMSDFVSTALAEGFEASYCLLDELTFVVTNQAWHIINSRAGRDISSYDLLFLRGKLQRSTIDVALVCWYAELTQTPARNSAYASRRAIGKLAQMYQLVRLGLPIPDTVCGDSKQLPKLIAEHIGYPAVVKDTHGSHGHNNYLVTSNEQLQAILQDNPGIRFMAQRVIPNNGDYRILVAGQDQLIILRQGSPDSHLNNTSQGGHATLVDQHQFSSQVIDQARQFAQYCNFEIAGVDVIFDRDTNKHYFLEINSQPQIASGAFVDQKAKLIGTYLRSVMNSSSTHQEV